MKLEFNCENFRENLYKFWQADKFCDVVLIASDGKTRIPAHRVVLEASGPNITTISSAAIDGATLRLLVGACYSGTLEISEDDVANVYKGAVHFQLNSLLNAMDRYIMAQLNNTNCLHFRRLADSLSRFVLFKASAHYISDNFAEVSQQPFFFKWDAKMLKSLLSFEYLYVPSSKQDLARWIRCDPNRKRDDLAELVPTLSLSSISLESTEAKEFVSAASVSNNIKCEKLIIVASSDCGRERIMEYLVEQNKWNTLAILPNTVSRFSVTYSEALKSLFFVGGFLHGLPVNDILIYNLQTCIFKNLSSSIDPRYDAGVTTINNGSDNDGDLIVAGGLTGLMAHSCVQRWSHKSNTWHSLSKTENALGSRLVTVGNLIYSIGGFHYKGNLGSVKCYNLLEKRWSTLAPLHHERYNCGVMVDKGMLYIVGGYSDVIECYESENNVWTEVCTVLGSAKVTICVRHNNRLFAFGQNTLFTSDGDWKTWSDTSSTIAAKIYGAFSIPRKDLQAN